ncbi:MAG TPA: glycosyltransferase family 39 protein [Chloroflexota bacterium]|jgi:4-amino-4-deoxy-L-arabinose transferase-like glycosyltransferase|nr:glycosyltransferase family 39 protein [Chloroflexota bacterium]
MAAHSLSLASPPARASALAELGALRLAPILLACLTFVSHAYNMFSYPLYLGDEGIYMEQAWTVLKARGLTPYTYFYDHAPAGWILIAAWLRLLPHGVYQWGVAINSGRVLMLLLAVTSTVLLYRLASRLTGSSAAGFLAGVIFALSPLSLYYGRMVLLDNIMLFWLLVALALITDGDDLFAFFGGGAAFGVALLTKETAIFFAPVVIYAVYSNSKLRPFFRFALSGWSFLVLAVVSFYPLFALLKGELFGTDAFLLRAQGSHVNLLGAIQWQLVARSVKAGSILHYANQSNGSFWDYYLHKWAFKDPVILPLGLAATLFNVATGLARRDLRRTALTSAALALSYAYYLVRGAVLLEFYIIPLLPFVALNIALAAHTLLRFLPHRIALLALVGIALATGIFFLKEHSASDAFSVQQTPLQVAQLAWVRAHIPTNAVVEIDDDLWTDLHDGAGSAFPVYLHAEPYSKIAGDPAVRRRDHITTWRDINYVVASNQMGQVLKNDTQDLTGIAQGAYLHSTVLAYWQLGGVRVEVRRVVPPSAPAR